MATTCPPPTFHLSDLVSFQKQSCAQMHQETLSCINARLPECLSAHIPHAQPSRRTYAHLTHAYSHARTHTHTGTMTQRGAAGMKAGALSSSPSGLVRNFLPLQLSTSISSQQQLIKGKACLVLEHHDWCTSVPTATPPPHHLKAPPAFPRIMDGWMDHLCTLLRFK